MLGILLWWTLAVTFTYEGRWNALYCNGSAAHFPAWLEDREPLYRAPSLAGYDGQWYHLLAHRPLEFRQSAQYMDWPRLRCQRLLFPLAVWLLAFGQFSLVDPAYFTLMLLSLGAGVYWTARLSELRGASALWGLMFLLMPGPIGSIDRMLLDGPLLAAAAGLFYFLETGRTRAAWTLAVLAPFFRETGLLLTAAGCAVWVLRRDAKRFAAWVLAGVPFLLWMYELRDLHGGASYAWLGWFANFARALGREAAYPYPSPWLELLQWFDRVAMTAFLCALGFAVYLFVRWWRAGGTSRTAVAWTAGLFAAAALVMAHLEPAHVWDEAYAYGRVCSPMWFALFLGGLEQRRPAAPLAVLAPVAARMGLHLASPAWRALRGLTGL